MNSRLLTLLSIFSIISSVFAQPDSLWSRTYGGSGTEKCTIAIQASDAGFVLAGRTDSYGQGRSDFWLLKTDSNGDSLWSHTYGGCSQDGCQSAIQTLDGGFALAGYTNSFGNGYNTWLVKTDSTGDSLWSRTYGGSGSEECSAIIQTMDGGYVLAGYTTSFGDGWYEYWILKTSENGDSLWSRTFGGELSDECKSIQQTEDGGYIVAGYTFSFGAGMYDYWLIKLNANGDSLWSRTYGGYDLDQCYSSLQTIDGGYVLAGITRSFATGPFDFWILKIDENGDSLWSRTYGGPFDDRCFSALSASDNGYLLSGSTRSYGEGNSDFWLVRIDMNGDSLWSLTYGGSYLEEECKVLQTNDNGFLIAGTTHSYGEGYGDFWLVKTGPDPVTEIDLRFVPHPSAFVLSAYPNPFNSELTLDVTGFSREVRVSLLNILGQEVEIIHEGVLSGSRIHYAAPAGLSSGLYFVQAKDAREVRTEKVVFLE